MVHALNHDKAQRAVWIFYRHDQGLRGRLSRCSVAMPRTCLSQDGMCLKSVQTGYVRIQEKHSTPCQVASTREDVGLEGYQLHQPQCPENTGVEPTVTTRMNVRISEALKLFLEYIKK